MLSDFGLGKLDAASADSVSQHIERCGDCRQRVASLSGDSFVGRLRLAGEAAPPAARQRRTYVPGESLPNTGSSTDGSSKEDGLPRPSRSSGDLARRDGLGSPASLSAPPELANHPDYELIKELGQGGMGTVYLARNRMMDRLEVLKVISKSLLDRPGALERFQQEIRSAAKLAHPNIVAAYTVLRPGEQLVFAMEYVRGQDLSEVVKQRGPLPVANAAFYIHQVANGLQHACEKGMVHRDIKPNNLMLAIEGKKHVVKILDFGLAKATSEKDAGAGLTKSGQMLGTPDYVAPEQTLDAHKADIRADIYSLGCTLYFLLSGGPPFQEASLFEILKAHHERHPRPLNLMRPEVPVELAAAVAKMMAKRPEDRYQTPAEVARALVPFFKPGQSVSMPPRSGAQSPQLAAETSRGVGVATPPPVAALSEPTQLKPIPVPPPLRSVPLPLTNTQAALAISIGTHGRKRHSVSRLTQKLWQYGATCAAVTSLVFGVIFAFRLPHGTITPDPSDHQANVPVPVDGDRIDIATPDKLPSPDRTVNLLALIDPKRDAIVGDWQLVNGELITPAVRDAQLEIPYEPPLEYRLTIVVECANHADSLNIGVVVGPSQAELCIDGWWKTISGMGLIDGKNVDANVTRTDGCFLSEGRPNTIVCAVGERRVQMTCNGTSLVDWQGDPGNLSLASKWSFRNRRRLFIGSFVSSFRISRLELEPLGEREPITIWNPQVKLVEEGAIIRLQYRFEAGHEPLDNAHYVWLIDLPDKRTEVHVDHLLAREGTLEYLLPLPQPEKSLDEPWWTLLKLNNNGETTRVSNRLDLRAGQVQPP
jgi:serine/threonine protein kinase